MQFKVLQNLSLGSIVSSLHLHYDGQKPFFLDHLLNTVRKFNIVMKNIISLNMILLFRGCSEKQTTSFTIRRSN